MNPMEEFKKQSTKEFPLGDNHKILITDLTTKDVADIEQAVSYASVQNSISEYQVRKIETLAKCIVSIDNVLLKNFPDVQTNIAKSTPEIIAIKNEINSWGNIITDKIYSYYLQFNKEQDKKIDEKINFQSSLS